jgi:hypothetical protein
MALKGEATFAIGANKLYESDSTGFSYTAGMLTSIYNSGILESK